MSPACWQVEADAPKAEPHDLCELLKALVNLSKRGATIPTATVSALAVCVGACAAHWEVPDAAIVMSCILQLFNGAGKKPAGQPTGLAGNAGGQFTEQTQAMSEAVVQALGRKLAALQQKSGSTSVVRDATTHSLLLCHVHLMSACMESSCLG